MNEFPSSIYVVLFPFLLIAATVGSANAAPWSVWNESQTIDDGWLYLEDPRSEVPAVDEHRLLAQGRKSTRQEQRAFTVVHALESENVRPPNTVDVEGYEPVDAQWKLLWSDDFDYTGLPDPKIWQQEEGYVRNGELQYYTNKRAKNARVEGGHLIIEAHKEHMLSPMFNPDSKHEHLRRQFTEYTSASVTTRGKKDLHYGRIDIRAKLPAGRGVWPAAWLLGQDFRGDADWPLCGEVDIMEHVGFLPTSVWSAVHTEKYNWTKNSQVKGFVTLPNPHENFHTYSLHWFPDRIEGFVDGKCHFLFRKEKDADREAWPFDSPHHLILNFAIGGGLGGKKGVDDSIFPQRYVIDYVRVFDQVKE